MVSVSSALLIVVNTCWLMLDLLGLPGNWLIVVSTCLVAWWRWEDGVFSIYTLIGLVVLAALGELAEFFAGMFGAKRAGAGWQGSFAALGGAIAGGILGTFLIPMPLVGTLAGACIGAGFGAWWMGLVRGKKMKQSVRYGVGAGIGEFFGITSKIALGLVIWVIVAVAAFCP